MRDFWAALGLVFVLEGVMYALFPSAMIRMAEQMRAMSPAMLRAGGLVAIGFGWAIVWLARHAG
ncbi:MAG: DUF2065 domain-containing protein [Zetaproteobacteria bacterium]|nr:MAG: DUF2065 domain-containing protein [Zetaproteobacteria bacterium]